MRTEAVIFRNTSPPDIDHLWSFVFWADTIFPMVGISKTSTRPAEVGYFQFLQRINYVIAHTICVSDGISLTNIKSAIDTPAKMFGEVSIDVLTDSRLSFVRPDDDCGRLLRLRYEGKQDDE